MSDRFEHLAIIVVNYGSSALLRANLLPLARSVPGARIVVVDNRTTHEERHRVESLAREHGWTTVLSDTNSGFGAGMNLGVARAHALGADRFLLANPDLELSADAVAALLDRAQRDPLALLSPRVLRPDGTPWFTGADLYLADGRLRSPARREQFPGARREEWLSGACLLLTWELWHLVGGFREEYFLYWEDVDLSHRVIMAGGSLEVCAEASAVHAEGGTQAVGAVSAGSPKSAIYYRYSIRNRLLFACLNLASADVRAWRRATPRIAWEVLLQGGRRQLLRGWPLAAAMRGVVEGRRLVRHELQRRHGERALPT